MKILYNNLLESATLSATNGNESYPVANILDGFLELKFQAITNTTLVTASWASDQNISSIGMGYHNAASGSYILKNSSGTSVLSGALEVAYDTNMTYFTETACRSIELTFTTTSSLLYIGGISVGVPFAIDYWNVGPRFDFPNSSSFTALRGGQAIGRPSFIGEKWRATIGEISNTQRAAYKAMIQTAKWWPCYADLYDTSHSEQRPIYAILEGDDQFTRDSYSHDYSATIVATEVR